MSLKPDDLPSDLASAQAALLIEREALRAERETRLRVEVERDAAAAKVTRIQAEAINWKAEAANARAKLSDNEALIAHLELRIEKLKRELAKLAQQALSDEDTLPTYARTTLEAMVRQIMTLSEEITALDRKLLAWHADSEASRRLAAIPGVGTVTATAIAATVTDPNQFRSGRQFAAWLGLTPQQHSTGGKMQLGGISKQGDRYLRRLLVVGATAVIRHTN